MKQLTVLIILPTNAAELQRCLLDVALATPNEKDIVIVSSSKDFELNQLLNTGKLRSRILQIESPKELPKKLNAAIRESSSNYFSILLSADIPSRAFYEKAIALLDSKKAHVAIPLVSYQTPCTTEIPGPADPSGQLDRGSWIPYCSVFRREDWVRVNGFNEQLPFGWMMWDFWLNLKNANSCFGGLEQYLFFVTTTSIESWVIANPFVPDNLDFFRSMALRNQSAYLPCLEYLLRERNGLQLLAHQLQSQIYHLDHFLGLRIHRYMSRFWIYRPIAKTVKSVALTARRIIIAFRLVRSVFSRG